MRISAELEATLMHSSIHLFAHLIVVTLCLCNISLGVSGWGLLLHLRAALDALWLVVFGSLHIRHPPILTFF